MKNTINPSNITRAKPDGDAVFSHINLQFSNLRSDLFGRNGVSKTILLKLITSPLKAQFDQINLTENNCILD